MVDRKAQLQALADAGHSQASAARELHISRERVRQLSVEHTVVWKVRHPGHPKLLHKVCPRCRVDKPRSDYYERHDGTIFWLCRSCKKREAHHNAD